MTLLDEVRSLEELGIGTLWVADHYAFPPRPSAPVLEAWTTLAALAAGTRRIRPGMMVGNVATGVAWQWQGGQITYAHYISSKEFTTQTTNPGYGAITLSLEY